MASVPDMRGFVPEPDGRGTIGILWSCVSTIIICAWTSLHPDLDIPKHLRPPDFQSSLSHKSASAALTLLAPEVQLAVAVSEYFEVSNIVRDVNTLFPECAWTRMDGYFAVMDGYVFNGQAVSATKVIELMQNGDIDLIHSDEWALRDRSKADSMTKFIACVQVSWLLIQCLARAIEHLPVSTLELGTVAYALITVVSYGFQWHKPKDVRTYTVLQPKAVMAAGTLHPAVASRDDDAIVGQPSEHGNEQSMHDVGVQRGEHDGQGGEHGQTEHHDQRAERDILEYELKPHECATGDNQATPQNNEDEEGDERNSGNASLFDRATTGVVHRSQKYEDAIMYLVFAITCPIYGLWHCLAWNFTFPSFAELWIWRVDSILCIAVGLVLFVCAWHQKDAPKASFVVLMLLFTHIVSRLMLLVEMFIGLRRLPAGVFDTVQWTTFIPHF